MDSPGTGDRAMKPSIGAPGTQGAQGARPGRWPLLPVAFAGAAASMALCVVVRGPGYTVATGLVLFAAVIALCLGRTRHRPMGFAGGWLAVPGVFMLLILLHSGALGDLFLSQRFDPASWRGKQGAPWDDRTRQRMVDDLRESGRLDHLTPTECVALLGEPSERRWGQDEHTWAWRLGPDRGIGIDSEWLCVRFGPGGRVTDHFLWTD
jgi:hypothetical protein